MIISFWSSDKALIKNNAKVAAQVAAQMSGIPRKPGPVDSPVKHREGSAKRIPVSKTI